MKKYRFHLISLVHLPQSKKYSSCAFTQKNIKLSRMLMSLGHEVYFYGPEGSEVQCTKFIQTHTLADIAKDYGDGDNRFEIGYDWTKGDFRHDFDKARKPCTIKFYNKCIEEINKVKKPDDFLLLSQGFYFKPIADGVKLFLTCESGVGYRGSNKSNYRAFESSFIQNYTYGHEGQLACINGNYYDRVIPNYFDSEDIEYSEEKKDYYLFIGRIIKRKGVILAKNTTQAIGAKLIIAGQGGIINPDGSLRDSDPQEFTMPHDSNWEYVGFANIEKRKKLFAHAIATFAPSEYLEIFGGVHIESILSGTPVITTDFGVYPGTVINGVNGYRCNTMDDFIYAAEAVRKLKPNIVRESGERYLSYNVKWDFQKWFDDLYQLYLSSLDNKTPRTVFGFNHRRNEIPPWRRHIKW